ncbi:MAG: lytic transglycosylase domain-containing protein [Alphaproteobacteria bacterium]|nr:MAG: lytic transglycosylase domain-containing protein [Alphaproteobacteria bacterium]
MRAFATFALIALTGLPRPALAQGETIDQALCRMIEGAAKSHHLPVDFFTRLIWQESSFRPGVTSHAGAQGVAQFMPGTARDRGLADPYDPEQAVPKSAELLNDLRARFGNLGLAAAAYNGGPARVESWLEGRGGLPAETRSYVSLITGRTAEDWKSAAREGTAAEAADGPPTRCLILVAGFRRGTDRRMIAAYERPIGESPLAPWGVQIAGNFSKALALATYTRERERHAAILSDVAPMVIGTRLRSRGTHAFYRVRIPAATRMAATELCERLRKQGGACVVLKS